MQYSYRLYNSRIKGAYTLSPLTRKGEICRFSKDERELRKMQTVQKQKGKTGISKILDLSSK